MTAEVPLWLSIVMALIGVAATIAGGLVGAAFTAKRDDRRWLEETKIDESRWWRDRRASLYSDILSVWRDLNEQFRVYAVVRDIADRDRKQIERAWEQLLVVQKRFGDLMARVQLEASGPAIGHYLYARDHVVHYVALVGGDFQQDGAEPRATQEELVDVIGPLVKGRDLFERHVRSELAVPDL